MEYFYNNEVNQLFLDYLEMRQEKGKKYKATNISIKRIINLLNKYDDYIKIKMLDNSIINNRTGIFPIKGVFPKESETYKSKEKKQIIIDKEINMNDEQKQKSKEILQKARNLFKNINDV